MLTTQRRILGVQRSRPKKAALNPPLANRFDGKERPSKIKGIPQAVPYFGWVVFSKSLSSRSVKKLRKQGQPERFQ